MVDSSTLWRQCLPIDQAFRATVFRQVDRTQAAVLTGTQPLLAAGIGGFQLIEVRNGILAVGGIDEQQPGLAVVMCLGDDLVEEFAGIYLFIDLERDTRRFEIFKGAIDGAIARIGDIREAQVPLSVLFDRLHEGVGDANRDIEIGNGVFIGLAADEILDIGVIHAQDRHIGAPPGATLGHLAEGVVVYAQEIPPDRWLYRLMISPWQPDGLRRENENPLPPPVCWIRAASRKDEKIPVGARPISSDTCKTKQAAS